MKDFTDILWLFLVVGSVVVSVVAKNKEQKRKKSQTPLPNNPSEEFLPEESSRMDGETAQQMQSAAGPGELHHRRQKQEIWQDTVQSPNADTPSYRKVPHPAPAGCAGATAATPETVSDGTMHGQWAATANNGAAADFTTDFDLQKAVVWSEILKPKFDEESH